MQIEVTKDDIKNSRKLIEKTNIRSTNYPTVLALKRHLPDKDVRWVSGYDDKIMIDNVFYDVSCDLSRFCDVNVFINRFDLGRKVYPFTLEVNYDEKS
jgi:hypothetical protein